MKTSELEKFNIAPEIIDAWQKDGINELFPVQEKIIYKALENIEKPLFLSLPTGAGKTFITEVIASFYLSRGKKVLYLLPHKALAEEKYEEFKKRYGPLGVRVVISTRDHREFDKEIIKGEFEVAIIIYEKFKGFLFFEPSFIYKDVLVILDEVQMISDEERGKVLDLILTRLKLISKGSVGAKIIALTSILERARAIAEWFRGRLIVEYERPVELRRGVLYRNTFKYVEWNSKKGGEEKFFEEEVEGEKEILFHSLRRFASGGESCLVFLSDREKVVDLAFEFADFHKLGRAEEAIKKIGELEDSLSKRVLIQLLDRGVGVHLADLTFEERRIIENAFRNKEILVLFATSTLEMGVNLPCNNVFVDVRKWVTSGRKGKPDLGELKREEVENRFGRAGRPSSELSFGRAVIWTNSSLKAKLLFEHYITSAMEEPEGRIGWDDLSEIVLDLIATDEVHSIDGIVEFLRSTFSYDSGRALKLDEGEALENAILTHLEFFERNGLIYKGKDNLYYPTAYAKFIGAKGIHYQSFIYLRDTLKEVSDTYLTTLEILSLLNQTLDARMWLVTYNHQQFRSNLYQRQFINKLQEASEDNRALYKKLFPNFPHFNFEEAKVIKKVLLFYDWLNFAENVYLEKNYSITLGRIRNLVKDMAWLLDVFAELLKLLDYPGEMIKKVEGMREVMRYGVPREAVKLYEEKLSFLPRSVVVNLYNKHLFDEVTLKSLSVRAIAEYIGDELANKVKGAIDGKVDVKEEREEIRGLGSRGEKKVGGGVVKKRRARKKKAEKDILYLETKSLKMRYLGYEIDLPLRVFQFIHLLAEYAGEVVSYETIYNSVLFEERFGTVPREQIIDLRNWLIKIMRKEIKDGSEDVKRKFDALVKNHKKVGYSLTLPKKQVVIR